ncbi:MAG: hypothetical protein GTO24_12120 [candidate division Zixibacteria bacterium]|nr:hypothetical protein [candidate division Zixibacteria bacterium]
MRKMIFVLAILILAGWAEVQADTHDSLRVAELEKIIEQCKDPLKIPPGIFKEIQTLRAVKPRPDFKSLRGIKGEGLVHVFVDSIIYPEIQTNFDQFVTDLQADGYSASVTKAWNQTPEDIRAILQSEYPSGLVGVILVGDVPAAWMETFFYYRSHFPTDYFYMDLNGSWNDYDSDGFYDNLYGDSLPEIWSGRITPSNCIFGDEVRLLNQYFARNHAYRTGALSLPDRALGYMECNWYPEVQTYLGRVYGDVTFVDHEDTTTALHYKYMLQQGYEWVHLLAHSSPWGSTFYLRGETYGGGSVFSYEMPHVNPQANFVLLNACSNAKYTETNNLGQSYLFGSDYALAVIGETRIMYGDPFEELYASLGTGRNLGESFLDWIWWYYQWFWGCNIFGDPTLKPHGHGNPVTSAGFSPSRMEKGASGWGSSPIDVSAFTDGNPSVCADHNGNIWVAWNAGRDVRSNIWTSRFDGNSWSSPQEIGFAVPWDFHPSVTTDDSENVWIFWQSYRHVEDGIDAWDIYGTSNSGSFWSSPLRITTADPYDVEPKSAVDSSGNVWVVWRAERKPDSDIMYKYYNGYGWTADAYVTASQDEERDPVITVDKDGKAWVFWYARKNGDWDIYAKCYDGSGWSSLMRVTDDPGYDLQPTVTADTLGRVWVVWRSNRDGNLDIYSKYYFGMNWSSDIPVTTHPGDDLCPSIAWDGGHKIMVTWQSNRDGHWNIYQSIYESGWSTPAPVTADPGNQIQPASFHYDKHQFGSVFPGDQGENWNIYCRISFIPGDPNGDGIVDAGDVVFLLSYLFRYGDSPVPLASGDANGDGKVQPSDIVYLLNYLFREGPAPTRQ